MSTVSEKIFTEYQALMDKRLSGVEAKIDKVEDVLGALPKQLADEIDKKYARKQDVKEIKASLVWFIKTVLGSILTLIGLVILGAIRNGWIN